MGSRQDRRDGMGEGPAARFTARLRLEPVTRSHAHDLWVVHNDDEVAPWYDGWKPSREDAQKQAELMDYCWREFGVHKWMAYDRQTDELVGRGGLSRTPVDDDWGRIYSLLPPKWWAREVLEDSTGVRFHAQWLEIGWALRRQFWGRGYATEIGRAGLDFAFEVLAVHGVVSCTARHNLRSRAVMERVGMPYAGTLDGLDGTDDLAVYVLLRTQR